jgi:hypothetical protein
MSILEDLLSEDLTTDRRRVIVSQVFDNSITDGSIVYPDHSGITRTLGNTKSLLEFYNLVRQAKDDYESRAGTLDRNKIIFTEEEPDIESETETITFSLIKRVPGSFGRGAPFEASVKNLKPVLRETGRDSENPGYNYAIHGYWYDNLVRFTCWARTQKSANRRAEWFEGFMEEYTWWYRMQGVSRILFWGRDADTTIETDNNKWYGRPFEYFVRTETLRVFSEKQIEEILIRLAVKRE